jgi:hypothetical protein
MAYLNDREQVLEAKIVYYGAARSGKTANLALIKQRMPEGRCGELRSLETAGDRAISFDWMPSYLGKVGGCEVKIQLHTVSGEVCEPETWRRVLAGADGVVFVLDSQPSSLEKNREALAVLRECLGRHGLSLERFPVIVQINKRDLSLTTTAEELLRTLGLEGLDYTEAVATAGQGVFETLREATRQVIHAVQEARRAGDSGVVETYPPSPVRMVSGDPRLLDPAPSRPLSGVWALNASPTENAFEQPIEATFGAHAASASGPLTSLHLTSAQDPPPSRRTLQIPMLTTEVPRADSPLRLASARPEAPRTMLEEILAAIRDQGRRVDVIEPAMLRLATLLADQERRLVSRVSELIEARSTGQAKLGVEQRLDVIASRVEAIEARLDERLGAMDTKVDGRFAAIIGKMDLRLSTIEDTVERGLEATSAAVTSRTADLEQRLGQRLASLTDQHSLALIDLVERISQQEPLPRTVLTDESAAPRSAGHVDSLAGHVDSLAGHVDSLAGQIESLRQHIIPFGIRLDTIDASLSPLGQRLALVDGSLAPLGERLEALDGRLETLGQQLAGVELRLGESTNALGSRLAPLSVSIEAQRRTIEGQRGTIDLLETRVGELALGVERKIEAVLFGLVDLESRNQDVAVSLGSLNTSVHGAREQVDALSTAMTGQLEAVSEVVTSAAAASEQSFQRTLDERLSALTSAVAVSDQATSRSIDQRLALLAEAMVAGDQSFQRTLDQRLAPLGDGGLKADDLEVFLGRLVLVLSGELNDLGTSTKEALAREQEVTRTTLTRALEETRALVLKARAELLHQGAGQEAFLSSYSARLDESLGRVGDSVEQVGTSIAATHEALKDHVERALAGLHQATQQQISEGLVGSQQATLAQVGRITAELSDVAARQFQQANQAITRSLGDIRGACSTTQITVKDIKASLGPAPESPITDQLTALEQCVRDLWHQTHRHFETVDTQLKQVTEVLMKATPPENKKGWWRP